MPTVDDREGMLRLEILLRGVLRNQLALMKWARHTTGADLDDRIKATQEVFSFWEGGAPLGEK